MFNRQGLLALDSSNSKLTNSIIEAQKAGDIAAIKKLLHAKNNLLSDKKTAEVILQNLLLVIIDVSTKLYLLELYQANGADYSEIYIVNLLGYAAIEYKFAPKNNTKDQLNYNNNQVYQFIAIINFFEKQNDLINTKKESDSFADYCVDHLINAVNPQNVSIFNNALEYLITNQLMDAQDLFFAALCDKNKILIDAALNHGADINHCDFTGTAIHHLIITIDPKDSNDTMQLISFLVEKEADLYICDKQNRTPKDLANHIVLQYQRNKRNYSANTRANHFEKCYSELAKLFQSLMTQNSKTNLLLKANQFQYELSEKKSTHTVKTLFHTPANTSSIDSMSSSISSVDSIANENFTSHSHNI